MTCAVEALRIGCVKYLNARPLIHGWDGPVLFDHPAALCAMLAAGQLDAAFVSSFEFLRDPTYAIVDNVAVASDGEVHSVFVVHRAPIEEIEEIALDPASRTSVNLLKCLCAERGLNPRFVPAAHDLAGLSAKSGRLMIGDQALRFREEHPRDYQFWDLGTEWKRDTSLPFVFALWLIRPEFDAPHELADRLRKRRDINLAALDDVIAAQRDFAPDLCARYFRHWLRFTFGDPEKTGLLKFRSLCEKHGLLPASSAPLRLV